MTDEEILLDLNTRGVPFAILMRVMELVTESKILKEIRSQNRERQAKRRANKSRDVTYNNVTKRDVTARHSASHDTTLPLNKKEEDLSKKESKKERGKRIAPDWTPSDADAAFAMSKGVDRSRIDLEAEKFRNYWSSKAGAAAIKLDWSATWRNWILDAVQRSPPRATNSRQPTEAERMGISREQYMRYIQIGFPPELIGGRNGKA